ncbi:hypothetical protein LSH36_285g03058 [Paralvinella palmiformis]|uniref:Uncharacterized protein n=1 Tax=Paralvinella palmiformis TaxID=53620 RepID=A0AAD9JII3_9ANNE|nr:hypothetical protein LSH36_285g03058 [Paralvinella palmiformis]
MDIDWTSKCIGVTTDEIWIYFSNALVGQMEKYIPKSVPKKNKRRKIWITKEVTAKHRMKQRPWKKYKETCIVDKKLKKLKVTTSAGPDGFHPRVLSERSVSIKLPLSIICKISYEVGWLPVIKKCSNHTNSQGRIESRSRKLSSGQI